MNTTTTRRPAGKQSTPAREQLPEVPAGEPMIGVLGSYTGTRPGIALALRCRRCPLLVEGDPVDVHARLRQHHRDEHGLVPQLPAPVKKTPERAAATPQVATVAPPSTPPPAPRAARTTPAERRSLTVPCTTILTGSRAGARRGQPCGRMSHDGTCWAHGRTQSGYHQARRERLAATRPPKPSTPCEGHECTELVAQDYGAHRRRRYCSVQCRERTKWQRKRDREAAS